LLNAHKANPSRPHNAILTAARRQMVAGGRLTVFSKDHESNTASTDGLEDCDDGARKLMADDAIDRICAMGG
jgi:hypothetical protein